MRTYIFVMWETISITIPCIDAKTRLRLLGMNMARLTMRRWLGWGCSPSGLSGLLGWGYSHGGLMGLLGWGCSHGGLRGLLGWGCSDGGLRGLLGWGCCYPSHSCVFTLIRLFCICIIIFMKFSIKIYPNTIIFRPWALQTYNRDYM